MKNMTKAKAVEDEKRAWAVSKLVEMQAAKGRAPHKEDFDVVTMSRIKAFLGPWPRALEQAGLKDPKRNSPKKKRGSR